MTQFIQEQTGVLNSTQELRRPLMTVLTDEDLAFKPTDKNLSLGEICREMGEIQRSYIDSFRSFKQDFNYRHDEEVTRSVTKLSEWYQGLDGELKSVLESLTDDDLKKSVDRGHGFAPPVPVQFHIYRESLLIFYAKVHVYLKAMGKNVPGAWQWWIGDREDYL